MNSIIGAIFSISNDNVNRLFFEGKSVFVKFTIFNRLSEGSKIVFYVSKEAKLIGEGTIEKIDKGNPKEIWERYKDRLFLDKEAYSKYVEVTAIGGGGLRGSKDITSFVLKDLKCFPKAILGYRITPAGRYFDKKEYSEITKVSK